MSSINLAENRPVTSDLDGVGPLHVVGLLDFPLIPLAIFLSETPVFFIKKGRMNKAKWALGRIRRDGVES
ncbi:hypothetical protein RND71_040917 [Anisodus tanguticus]|uniref:Uncharacterized protein n=1 Tax=Anisodus tanguticus TaxID=243964 RepID=A0AAE1QTM8_9SOLA|nr:hypothetical protein RND71_040917 [Anisodus tanguticus]